MGHPHQRGTGAQLAHRPRPRRRRGGAPPYTAGFAATPLDAALAVLDLNCRAVVTLAHAFLVRAEPGAALVNVSSTLGATPKPGLSVYSASKAFVTSFSETLWHEQKARGVHVMALCPGVTVTESQRAEDVPSWLVRKPDEVVARALAALAGRKGPTVVSNRRNALLTTAMRLLPRKAVVSLLGTGNDDHPLGRHPGQER